MPQPGQFRADGVSVVMKTVHVERRLVEAEHVRPRIDARVPIFVVCACVVFAAFFAIGRVTIVGSASRVETQSGVPLGSVSTAIPLGLSSAAPLDVGVGAGAGAARESSPASPAAPAASAAPAKTVTSQTPVVPAPASQPTPPVAPAPAPSAPSSGGTSGSVGSSGGGSGTSKSSSEGGSFDTSG